jgi:hypothetical protein
VYDESSRRVSRGRSRAFRNSFVGFDITPQGIKRTAHISQDEPVDIVRQLRPRRQEFVRGYLSALIYAGLGDKIKAIDYF